MGTRSGWRTVRASLGHGVLRRATGVVITEWMYQGDVGEFVEFTNLGPTAIDFTGWSYDDDSRLAGTFPLSDFGVVAPGESVIITETNASTFRADWGLPRASR